MRKTILWSVIAAVGFVLVGAAYLLWSNGSSPIRSSTSSAWNKRMVEGSESAPHKVTEYSDYFCEYCHDFYEQASSPEFQEKYLDTGLVQLETRIITVLSAQSPNTLPGASAAYCAADQDKFVEYTDHIMPRIKHDFFDKGLGVARAGNYQPIDPVELSYFLESAKAAGVDVGVFRSCMESDLHRHEIEANTRRAVELGVEGLPSVLVNDKMSKGFQNGWRGFEMMLKSGGVPVK